MSNRLVGTQTAINLGKTFAGESQARNRYQLFAEAAREAGFASLEDIFLQTANDELGHAETVYGLLTDGLPETTLEPSVLVPAFRGTAPENLLFAAKGENLEWSVLYPQFAQVAQQEGFPDIAQIWQGIASVEKRHDTRFRDLHARALTDALYTSCLPVTWQCLNCGYRHTGAEAPQICPSCLHPQHFYYIVHPCIP